jgi:(p)ppGpp synthase/HD superfamily hydrolase
MTALTSPAHASLSALPRLPDDLLEVAQADSHPLGRKADELIAELTQGRRRAIRIGPGTDTETVVIAAVRLGLRLIESTERDEAEQNIETAREALVPVLVQLGMWSLKRWIEDAALRAQSPERYARIDRGFAEFREVNARFIKACRSTVLRELTRAGLHAEALPVFCVTDGAARRLKALELGESFRRARIGDFFDLFVIVDDYASCYGALAAVHRLGVPVPGTFADLTSHPRANGFSGLLTRVSIDPPRPKTDPLGSEVVSIVIQTQEMHSVATDGVMARACRDLTLRHNGSDGETGPAARVLVENVLQSLMVKPEQRLITVFTAGGESRFPHPHEIPENATVLDLAYYIHSGIGNGATHAIVNDRRASLGQVLQSRDVVRVIWRDGREVPSPRTEDDLQRLTMRRAQGHLKQLLHRDPGVRGRRMIAQHLERRGLPMTRVELDAAAIAVLDKFKDELDDRSVEGLYRYVSANDAVGRAANLIEQSTRTRGQTAQPSRPQSPTTEWRPAFTSDPPTTISRVRLCRHCSPGAGDPIVAVVIRGGATVHAVTCRHASRADVIPMQWLRVGRTERSVLTIYADDRALLVHDVAERIFRRGCGLEEIEAKADQFGRARVHLHVWSHSALGLGDLVDDLRTTAGIRGVTIKTSTLPESDQALIRGTAWRRSRDTVLTSGDARFPAVLSAELGDGRSSDRRSGDIVLLYNEQRPAYSPEVFFGREREVRELQALSEPGSGRYVLITGPRRIGKTSLALRYLDDSSRESRPYHRRVDLRDCKKATSAEVLKKVAAKVRSAVGGPAPIATDPTEQIDELVHRSDRPVVLILDEFGAVLESFLSGTLGDRFPTWLRSTMEGDSETSQKLGLIMVAVPEALDWIRIPVFAPYFERLHPLSLGALDHEAAASLITTPLSMQGVKVHNEAVSEMIAMSGARPHLTIHLLHEVVRILNLRRAKWEVSTADVHRAVERMLEHPWCFDMLANEPGSEPEVRACIHALAVTRRSASMPVRPTEIVRSTNLPPAVVDEVLSRLVRFQLVEHCTGAEPGYRFTSPLVRRWIRRQAGDWWQEQIEPFR